MTILEFDMEQVAGLAHHVRTAPARRMSLEQRARIYGDHLIDVPQPDEELRAPAILWLVKDNGIYLMSPGFEPGRPHSSDNRAPTAYAAGFNPHRDDPATLWDRCRAAVGGDDFSDEVPLAWVDAALATRSPAFAIKFTPQRLLLVPPPHRPRRPRQPRHR